MKIWRMHVGIVKPAVKDAASWKYGFVQQVHTGTSSFFRVTTHQAVT
jgi:hypothetical protein